MPASGLQQPLHMDFPVPWQYNRGMRKILLLIAASAIAASLHAETVSWYTATEPGYFTASGTIFDDSKDGAASDTIPLGSVVELSNPATGLSLVTTITDTLPELPEGRSAAVTASCAEKLGMMRQGTADLKISVVREGTIGRKGGSTGWYSFDLGIFSDTKEALKIYSRLIANGLMPDAEVVDGGVHLRVRYAMAYQLDDIFNRIALSGVENAELQGEVNPYL